MSFGTSVVVVVVIAFVVGDLVVVFIVLVLIVVDSILSVVTTSSELSVVSPSNDGNRLSRLSWLMLKHRTDGSSSPVKSSSAR